MRCFQPFIFIFYIPTHKSECYNCMTLAHQHEKVELHVTREKQNNPNQPNFIISFFNTKKTVHLGSMKVPTVFLMAWPQCL